MLWSDHNKKPGAKAMRTTLDLDDDVLQAVKELARQERVSVRHVVSHLLRVALSDTSSDEMVSAAGFRPFAAPEQRLVTNALIDQLRDAEGV